MMFNRSDQLVLAHIVPGRPLVVSLLVKVDGAGGGNLLVDGPGLVRPRILASLVVVPS